MSERGKIAIITGAGTGIGNRIALALLEKGYSVTLAGRRVGGPGGDRSRSWHGEASRVLVVPTDVGDPGAVQALFAGPSSGSAASTFCLTTPGPPHLRYLLKT